MRRRWFVLQGAVLIASGLLLTGLFGPATLADPANAFQTGALVLSGVLLAVGGLGVSLGGLRWYQFVGAGDVLLGASLAVNLPVRAALAGTAPAEDLLFGAATAVGGLTLSRSSARTGSAAGRTSTSRRSSDAEGPGADAESVRSGPRDRKL